MTVTQGIISWAIIAAMLAAGMPANPDAGDTDTGTPDTGDIDTGDVESGESGADTDEPEYYDYHGYNFKIANLMSDGGTDWTVDELNGNIVNDAIYARNRRVEDMYNIYMTEIPATLDDVRGSVLSGEDEYDIVDLGISDLVRLATERMILDVSVFDKFDFTQPYWDNELMDSLQLGGKRYFLAGAANLSTYEATHMLAYNKQLAEEYELGDLGQLVMDGQWTVDKFGELSDKVYLDINGDGVLDFGDQFGYLAIDSDMLASFTVGADESLIDIVDGQPVFGLSADERFAALIEKLTGIDIKYSRLCTSTIDEEVNLSELFLAGNALFYDVTLSDVFELRRANEVDIGLVPYPKYDVTQPDYLSRVENSAVTAIPITARDPDRTSVIVEALAVESYNYVLTAFYEVMLLNRYSRDEDSLFMLDIALAGRRFDLGDAAWGDVVRDRIAVCLEHNNGISADDAPTPSELAAPYQNELDRLCADFVFE